MTGPWNANIHYDGRLYACVPASARSVLDVGCDDGFLAARLARRVPLVVAIDIDALVLERAQARFPGAKVTWCHGLPALGAFGLAPVSRTAAVRSGRDCTS